MVLLRTPQSSLACRLTSHLGLIPIEAVGDSRQFVFDFMGQAARRFHFRCQLFERTQTIVARKRGDQTQSRQAVLCFAISPHAPDHTAWMRLKKASTCPRRSRLRRTVVPCASTTGAAPLIRCPGTSSRARAKTVNEGGQAIVGNVNHGGKGSLKNREATP